LFQLVQSFKEIKAKGTAVIQKMSADISTKAQEVGSSESKQEFIDACESLKGIPQVRASDLARGTTSLTTPSGRIKDRCLRSRQIRRISQKVIGGNCKGYAKNRHRSRIKSTWIPESRGNDT
jgi:hypothetical protein